MPRLGVTVLAVPALFAATVLPASRTPVLVVAESGVEAYIEALGGITSVLPAGTFRVIDAAAKTFDRDLSGALEENDSRAVIAVGSRALAGVRAHHPAEPVIATMVLNGSEEPGYRRVDLEVHLAAQLATMRVLWPGRTRAGIIRNPARPRHSSVSLEAIARKEGFSVMAVDCDGPGQLLKALAELKGKVDFVLCLPDPDLYNAVTIKPLVLASLEDRLPLVGFSPALVRAGAAAGIFPDYADVGRQSAEWALRLMRGEDRGTEKEAPRKIRIAVNQRVVHLLGIEFHPDAVGAEVYR